MSREASPQAEGAAIRMSRCARSMEHAEHGHAGAARRSSSMPQTLNKARPKLRGRSCTTGPKFAQGF